MAAVVARFAHVLVALARHSLLRSWSILSMNVRPKPARPSTNWLPIIAEGAVERRIWPAELQQ
jgi:hypothetical protein